MATNGGESNPGVNFDMNANYLDVDVTSTKTLDALLLYKKQIDLDPNSSVCVSEMESRNALALDEVEFFPVPKKNPIESKIDQNNNNINKPEEEATTREFLGAEESDIDIDADTEADIKHKKVGLEDQDDDDDSTDNKDGDDDEKKSSASSYYRKSNVTEFDYKRGTIKKRILNGMWFRMTKAARGFYSRVRGLRGVTKASAKIGHDTNAEFEHEGNEVKYELMIRDDFDRLKKDESLVTEENDPNSSISYV